MLFFGKRVFLLKRLMIILVGEQCVKEKAKEFPENNPFHGDVGEIFLLLKFISIKIPNYG